MAHCTWMDDQSRAWALLLDGRPVERHSRPVKPSSRSLVALEDVPAYILSEAAALVGIPTSTLSSWTKGRQNAQGTRTASAIIVTPEPRYLSFTNLVEAHVLAALRTRYRVKLAKIRTAVAYIDRTLKVKHALAREVFRTDGIDIFVDRLGSTVNVSRGGQETMRGFLEEHLERVEYDDGRAVRFFPLHRANAPRVVVVDPRYGFGRPTLCGTSVPVADIASRFRHGDDIEQIAADLEVTMAEIQEAIRAVCEAA